MEDGERWKRGATRRQGFFFLCQAKFLPWAGRHTVKGASGDHPPQRTRVYQHGRDNRESSREGVEVDVTERANRAKNYGFTSGDRGERRTAFCFCVLAGGLILFPSGLGQSRSEKKCESRWTREGRGHSWLRNGLPVPSGLLLNAIELVELKLKLEFPFWERVKPET